MDDLFLDIYADAAEGRVDQARLKLERLPKSADPERVEEMAAFLDSMQKDAQELPSAGAPDLTHPGRDLWNPPDRDPIPFHCLSCGHDVHVRRTVLLNRRFTTFFGFDLVDRSAVTYGCVGCGRIVWFGHAAPGFVQSWIAGDDRLTIAGSGEIPCTLCGFRGLRSSRALLNTFLMTFLGLDWLDEGAHVEHCQRCGLLHWWGSKTTNRTATSGDKKGRCEACGGCDLHEHHALLNSRAAAAIGLDWLNRAAWVLRCADCQSMTWWTRPQLATE